MSRGASPKGWRGPLVRLSNSPITSGVELSAPAEARGLKVVKTLAIVWILSLIGFVPVGMAVLAKQGFPGDQLIYGGLGFATPVSLVPLIFAAMGLFASRKHTTKGLTKGWWAVVVMAFISIALPILHRSGGITLAMEDSSGLDEPVGVLLITAVPVLAIIDAWMYFAERGRGLRRMSFCAAVAVTVISAIALVARAELLGIEPPLIAISLVSIAGGLSVLFGLLILTSTVRWVRSGFLADRSNGSEAQATTAASLEGRA